MSNTPKTDNIDDELQTPVITDADELIDAISQIVINLVAVRNFYVEIHNRSTEPDKLHSSLQAIESLDPQIRYWQKEIESCLQSIEERINSVN